MADFTKEELAEAIAKANAKQARTSPPKTSTETKGTGMGAIDLGVDTFKKAIDPFGSAMGVAGKGVSALSDALNQGKDTWRDLSKSGAGFNNDIVGMTVAAAGTRLPLREFAGVIKDNTDILGQLGGSVTRGAESFARMSKSFFESGATDSLKQLGYTNKDLNEVLALQAVTLRGSFKDEQERNEVAIKQAGELATEMDLMAKLTGKSREAQMEQMKKNQMDMQFEAAIRLKTQGMNATEAAAFEANARMQLKDAQLRGAGDMFKEVFATGQIQSKEAATQAAVNQEQYEATRKQALASSIGDEKAASAANREAQRAAAADANNTTKLGMVALGNASGAAGKALSDSMGAQITATKALEGYAAANKMAFETEEDKIKVQKAMEADAKKAQSGQDKDGKQVDGVTKAAVALENTVDKVRAGLTAGLLEPLNKEVGPKLGDFAKNVDAMNKNFGGSGKDTSRAIEDSTKKGFAQGVSDKTPSRFERTPGAGGPLGIAESVGGVAGGTTNVLGKGIDKVNQYMEPSKDTPRRQGGSLDMTGGMFENWGKGTMVELHGMEGVMRPQDIEKIVETSLGGAKKSLSSASAGGIDLSKISKDISTSVSSVSGGGSSTVKGPDMREMSSSMSKMGMNDSQKKVFDEMMSLSSQQSKEKLASLAAEKDAASAANKAATAAIDAMEEKLEAEGKGFKDLTGSQKTEYEALRKQQNDSFNAADKARDAITAAERAEENRLSLQKMGYEVGIKQEEDKAKIVEEQGEKIKADIVNALPVKDIASKVDESKTVLSDHQKTVLKYAYEDTEGKKMQLDNQKNLIKGELNSIAEKNKQIEEIQNEADGRELTRREQNRIETLKKEIESGKETLKYREEELFVYQNLDKLKAESSEKTASVLEETTEKINNDIKSAVPVDTEFGNLDKAIADQKSMDNAANMDMFYGGDAGTANPDQSAGVMSSSSNRPASGGAMKDLTASTAPTATQSRGITMDSFTIGPNGMPIAKPKSTAAATPDKPAEKQASPGKKINPETGEEYTPVGDSKPGDKPGDKKGAAGGGEKSATLDDVVKSLNALNTKMGQLISVNEDGHKASAKAAKSGSNNLYAR